VLSNPDSAEEAKSELVLEQNSESPLVEMKDESSKNVSKVKSSSSSYFHGDPESPGG
jgi:hypothetical protein